MNIIHKTSCVNQLLNTQSDMASTPRRYPYFGVVAGLVWSNDPESYAGSSVCYW
jgi:hypothetical protein